jgi:type IV pilus assembly protein PilE
MIAKQSHRALAGFTLVELMITLAIITILGAIAVPAYIGYIEEGKMSSVRGNIEPLRLALEDYFLENATYAVGTWKADKSDTSLDANIGWHPDGDGNIYDYTVTESADSGCTIATCYKLTVTNTTDTTATITCNRNQTKGTFTCP